MMNGFHIFSKRIQGGVLPNIMASLLPQKQREKEGFETKKPKKKGTTNQKKEEE